MRISKGEAELDKLNGKQADVPGVPGYYAPDDFGSDILETFTSTKGQLPNYSKLKDVANDFEYQKEMTKTAPMAGSRHEAAEFRKFHQRFRKSAVKDLMIDAAEGDAAKAAEMFLDILHKRDTGQGSGDYGEGMNQFLKAFEGAIGDGDELGSREALLQAIKDGSTPDTGNGNSCQAGSSVQALVQHMFDVKQLIPLVRSDYEFMATKRTKRIESDVPTDDIEPRPMATYEEISRISVQDWAMCDDQDFDRRIAARDFNVAQHYELETETRKFDVFLDVSGSMSSGAGVPATANTHGEWTKPKGSKAAWATAAAIVMLENCFRGENEVKFYYFDSDLKPALTGNAAQIAKQLWTCSFSGGGTNFEPCFRQSDIDAPEISILITDGQASFNSGPTAPLYVLDLESSTGTLSGIARKIYKVSRYIA